jgi:hypothetical protein
MSNIQILLLFFILMYVLLILARCLWPKRADDERITAPFVKRRQRAMIWSTIVVAVAVVGSLTIWQVPEAMPEQLKTRQYWSIQGSQGGISVRGEGEQWIGPFSQVDQVEPLSIEFSKNRQTVRVVRESASMLWSDDSGAAVDATEVINRLGADPALIDLMRATLNESWVDGSLLQMAQSVGFGPVNPYPAQPELYAGRSTSHGEYGMELVFVTVMIVWVMAGLLIVIGLGFDRWKFKRRGPAATLPA